MISIIVNSFLNIKNVQYYYITLGRNIVDKIKYLSHNQTIFLDTWLLLEKWRFLNYNYYVN